MTEYVLQTDNKHRPASVTSCCDRREETGRLSRLNCESPSQRLRYVLLPISSSWTTDTVVPQEGFEPPTPSLRMMCSTG